MYEKLKRDAIRAMLQMLGFVWMAAGGVYEKRSAFYFPVSLPPFCTVAERRHPQNQTQASDAIEFLPYVIFPGGSPERPV